MTGLFVPPWSRSLIWLVRRSASVAVRHQAGAGLGSLELASPVLSVGFVPGTNDTVLSASI